MDGEFFFLALVFPSGKFDGQKILEVSSVPLENRWRANQQVAGLWGKYNSSSISEMFSKEFIETFLQCQFIGFWRKLKVTHCDSKTQSLANYKTVHVQTSLKI
jgi:hypothetical protein